ncbi:MAG: 3-octaprenyl-4-hydroxybenzoate carboxy-lyase [Rhodospirillaceae bacterium]|nr:3-octaprenyl-4-hydroxybenzoate carboxy-lyase [Rhodospirillaceae bacterium]HAA92640.1 3-octaprenyl-4-hydroxybenzoate carboxy-lyase [Rhodospirillaceae bacterium]|tara:strand:- start:19 stop:606 length:588 start_codon:yes stop_codon:yes gene_type:complete
MSDQKRMIVAISGASGPIYGVRMLEVLHDVPEIETHLVLSPSAAQTIAAETDFSLEHVRSLADVVHSFKDIGASISSGSYKTEGMIVAPCSIKTLAGVVNCFSDNLISRAADVCLKEGRKVGLMVRETPLHQGHLELMVKAAQYGCVIIPPVPAFYHRPRTIDDIVNQTVGRALDQFGIDTDIVHRWKEKEQAAG